MENEQNITNEQVKPKFPIGIILILVIIGWAVVSGLFGIFQFPSFQLGPILFLGIKAIIINLVIIVIFAIMFFGILKRMIWAKKLTIFWLILAIIQTLVNLVSFLGNRTMYNDHYQKFLPPQVASLMTPSLIIGNLIVALIFTFIFGFIVIIYLLRKKDFFVN